MALAADQAITAQLQSTQGSFPEPERSHGSQIRQRFHEDCEQDLNKHVRFELHSSYFYLAVAFHFKEENKYMPGCYKWFKHKSDLEWEHANLLMKYINKRGGNILLEKIIRPDIKDWRTALEAFQESLILEKNMCLSLNNMHQLCVVHEDAQMCNFLENTLMKDHDNSVKVIADYVSILHRFGIGIGEYLLDKDLLQQYDEATPYLVRVENNEGSTSLLNHFRRGR